MNECHICTYMAPPAMFAQLHLNIVGKAGGGCVCDKEKGKKKINHYAIQKFIIYRIFIDINLFYSPQSNRSTSKIIN